MRQGIRTASPDEIAHFTAIAEDWWDPKGKFRPLHLLNPVRIAYVRDTIIDFLDLDRRAGRPFHDLRLVDIGCGGGLLAEPMARLGASVTGIDASEKSVRVAEAHALQGRLDIEYLCALPEDLVDEGRSFDIVLNMEVVEHVKDLDAFFAATTALLEPGGVMIVATLNRTLKSLALAKIGAEYILRWLPAGTHDWSKFVRPSELGRTLNRHGVQILDRKGVEYSPLTDRWRITNDLSVNYMVFGVRR
jgi:2-polyprenyl-6-hydroxyphenyl methylase/3-demethylubiquinone-9 3-methyltransferase